MVSYCSSSKVIRVCDGDLTSVSDWRSNGHRVAGADDAGYLSLKGGTPTIELRSLAAEKPRAATAKPFVLTVTGAKE